MSNNSDRKGYERVPRPKDSEALLATFSKILEDEAVDRIIIDRAKPYILIEKAAQREEEAIDRLLYETTRNKIVEEYIPSAPQISPYQQLCEMYQMISEEGLAVNYLLAGNREQLAAWLKVRIPRTRPFYVFGTPVLFNGQLPGDTFLLCGADTVDTYAGDVIYSIKGAYS